MTNAKMAAVPEAAAAKPTRRVLILGGAALSGLAGCERLPGARPSPASFNFVLSLTVELDGVRKVASSVQQFLWRGWSTDIAAPNRTVTEMVGEGAVADFGDQGVVVSTFFRLEAADFRREPSPYWGRRRPLTTGWPVARVLAQTLLPPIRPDQSEANWWLPLSTMGASTEVEVPREVVPLIVWFPDRATAQSVRRIDMDEPGGGPEVIAATVALTRDPLTNGSVDAALPWFASYRHQSLYLSGKPTDRLDGSVPGVTHSLHLRRGLPEDRL